MVNTIRETLGSIEINEPPSIGSTLSGTIQTVSKNPCHIKACGSPARHWRVEIDLAEISLNIRLSSAALRYAGMKGTH